VNSPSHKPYVVHCVGVEKEADLAAAFVVSFHICRLTFLNFSFGFLKISMNWALLTRVAKCSLEHKNAFALLIKFK